MGYAGSCYSLYTPLYFDYMFRIIINGNRGTRNIFISIGLTLIIISMLVFLYPKVFAYIFAGIVGLIGLFLVFNALFAKSSPPGNNDFDGYNRTEDSTYQELNDHE